MNPDTKSLVDAIVKGLVVALGQKNQPVGPVVMVHSSPRDKKLEREIQNRLGNDVVIHFQGDVTEQEPDFNVIPELSCSDMVDLAQGKGSSLAMRGVLELLLQGKRVHTMGFAFRAFAKSAPQALLRMYEANVATLASFGLYELAPVADKHCPIRKMLITADDVRAIPDTTGELHIPHGAIVTQLALDEAAARGLNIIKAL